MKILEMIKEHKKMLKVIGITSLIILLLFGLFYFYFGRPILGKVVEERPIFRKLCELQWECHVGTGGLRQCGYSDNTPKHYKIDKTDELSHISWYMGCNESTPGFTIGDAGIKYIKGISSCNCEALS